MLGPTDLVLCSGTLPRATTFGERLEAATAGGFSAISLWGRDYWSARRDGHSDADLRARLADRGLAVAEIDPEWSWTPITVDSDALAAIDDMELFRYGEAELFAVAEAVGARSINAVDILGGRWDVDAAAAALAGLCDRAAERGLLVHVEFLPWSKIPDVSAAWDIVRGAGRANAGIAIDAWHWYRSDPNLDVLRAIPGAKVFAVQLADAPRAPETDLMSAALHDRLLPGNGAIDLAGLLTALHDIGAVAPIGVEVISDELHALGPIEAARRAGAAARRVLE